MKWIPCRMLARSALAMLVLTPPLVGCAMVDGRVKALHCAGWKPVIVSPDDVLTDATARAILEHDLYGVKSGCWKAPGAKHSPRQEHE